MLLTEDWTIKNSLILTNLKNNYVIDVFIGE